MSERYKFIKIVASRFLGSDVNRVQLTTVMLSKDKKKTLKQVKKAFELRLWDARICRWLTTDPKEQYSSPYLGMGNNPMIMFDPDGGYAFGPGPGLPFIGESIDQGFRNWIGSINKAFDINKNEDIKHETNNIATRDGIILCSSGGPSNILV